MDCGRGGFLPYARTARVLPISVLERVGSLKFLLEGGVSK